MQSKSHHYKYLIETIKQQQQRKLIISMGSKDIIAGTLYI